MAKNWYVIYTQSRGEKKVHQRLMDAGIESYCPLNTVLRKWTDRIKKVEEPLFKSYVFVHIAPTERQKVLSIPGVVNFIYWLKKPAVVRDQEIEDIRRFLGEYVEVEAHRIQTDIEPGSRLRITSGVLMDKEAVALNVHKKYVEVLIESIGFRLVATVEKKRLQKV